MYALNMEHLWWLVLVLVTISYIEVGRGCKSYSNTHTGLCAVLGGRLKVEGEAAASQTGAVAS
jgi:hypothetical protein